jgi:hypothetical protein
MLSSPPFFYEFLLPASAGGKLGNNPAVKIREKVHSKPLSQFLEQ